jgi:hypothetical protein
MAKRQSSGGFFSRIARAVRDFFSEPPEQPPPLEEQYPEFPPPGYENLSDYTYEDESIWHYITGERRDSPEGEEWWNLYIDTGITRIENNREEVDRLWRDFLRSFYNNDLPRQDWYEDTGLTKDRIDWATWRELKRS